MGLDWIRSEDPNTLKRILNGGIVLIKTKTKKIIYTYVDEKTRDEWNCNKTRELLSVYDGGYCTECGCVANFDLICDYWCYMSSYYQGEYRFIKFVCRDCSTEYNLRIGVGSY